MALRPPPLLSRQLRTASLESCSLLNRPVYSLSTSRRWICRECRIGTASQLPRPSAAQAPSCRLRYTVNTRLANVRQHRYEDSRQRYFTVGRLLAQDSGSTRSEKPSPARTDGVAAPLEGEDALDKTKEKIQKFVDLARQSYNELTGYTEIYLEKQSVASQRSLIEHKRLELQEARDGYRSAVDKHAASLRESRDLLARKDEWSEMDAGRFATLHVTVKANENAENRARRAMQQAELALEREIETLSTKIGAVYQAETMYNSKVLQLKTWWTWALFIFNGSIFLFNLYLLQVGLSPKYKSDIELSEEAIAKIHSVMRDYAILSAAEAAANSETGSTLEAQQGALGALLIDDNVARLGDISIELLPSDTVASLKNKIKASQDLPYDVRLVLDGVELDNEHLIQDLPGHGGRSVEIFSVSPTSDHIADGVSPQNPSMILDSIQTRARALLSTQAVTMQMRDVTGVAVQSALAGAAVTGLVLFNLRRG